MAKATVVYTHPLTSPPTEQVILVMSGEEAQALQDILFNVGGHPKATRRGLTEGISNALIIASPANLGLFRGLSTTDIVGKLEFTNPNEVKTPSYQYKLQMRSRVNYEWMDSSSEPFFSYTEALAEANRKSYANGLVYRVVEV